MANKTLADLQRQWYAEDTGASGAGTDANPLASHFPQIGSLFTKTKVSSSNGSSYGIAGPATLGGFPFGGTQAFPSTQNNYKEIFLIAGALVVVVFAAVILKAAR